MPTAKFKEWLAQLAGIVLVVCRANARTYDSNKYIGVKYYNQLLITNLKQCLDACIILK